MQSDGRDDDVDRGGASRRSFLTKVGMGAAAAWTAPVLLSSPASAGPGTAAAPFFVAASNGGTENCLIFCGTRTVSAARPTGVQTGDLLVAIVVAEINDTLTSFPGWTLQSGPDSTSATDSVRTYLYTRTVVGAEPATYTATFSSGSDRGPLRLGVAAFRAPGSATATYDLHATTVTNTATSTPPWAAVSPTSSASTVVRLGAVGRWTAVLEDLLWVTPNPGWEVAIQTTENDYGTDTGSRALHISYGENAGPATGNVARQNWITLPPPSPEPRKAITYSVSIVST